MARYTVPKVYYQSCINANTAVEVAYIKSLSWADRMNNNGNFELIIPIDSSLTPFVPVLGGYIRLSPGDTIMKIEKKERICDEKGNFWYKLGGRPKLQNDDTTRDAQNNNYFFRYVYNGVNSETYVTKTIGTPVTTLDSCDVIESSVYEDNLGGFTEEIQDTVYEAYSWGTTITGRPKPVVTEVTKAAVGSLTIPGNALARGTGNTYFPYAYAGQTIQETFSITSHNVFEPGGVGPSVSQGSASGANGRMDRIAYQGSWFSDDVISDVPVGGTIYQYYIEHSNGVTTSYTFHNVRPIAIIPKRTVTLKSDSQYQDEMRTMLPSNASGSMPAKIIKQVSDVKGGHAGYSFTLKSKGEVEKRYKVDFNLGDTIAVNDTRLGVLYTGVVSGAVETIDGNGYRVDIEIGTLGATLEQRIQKVI